MAQIEKINYSVPSMNQSNNSNSTTNNSAPSIKEVSKNLVINFGDMIVRSTADKALLYSSFVEGMLGVGEKIRDSLEMTGCAAIGATYITDQAFKIVIKDIFGKTTEKDWKELDRRIDLYKIVTEDTKAEVAENMLETYMFNPFYEKTRLLELSHNFELYRNIGNGFGETAEIIGLSLAGAYLAGGGAGAASSSTSIESLSNLMDLSSAKISRAFLGALSGSGEGMQDSFQDGASVESGMVYGYAKGVWDAFQWVVGDGIRDLEIVGNSKILNSLSHIGLHSIDGGAEGFVQPLLQKIYKNDSYGELFNANGGWSNVGTQTVISGMLSGLGEITKHIRMDGIGNENSIININAQTGNKSFKNELVDSLREEVISDAIDEFLDNSA